MKKQSSTLISKLLNKNSQPVPSAKKEEQIVMRDARDILPNPKNGTYSMDSIEELAAMIQLTHNIEPVTVKELPDGSIMLTSGHRRRLAQIYRFEQGMVDVPMLPTITREIVNEFSGAITDDEMETLNIVFPNKGQRRHLSPSEEAAEIEMIRPILYKIYEHEKSKGNIQGKFRTFFAEILQISEATLHRKEAINKVSDEIKSEVDAGNIAPTAAAALAAVDKEKQNTLVQSIKDKGLDVTVESVKQARQEMAEEKGNPEDVVPALENCTEDESFAPVTDPSSHLPMKETAYGNDGLGTDVLQEAHKWLCSEVNRMLQESEHWLEHLKRNHRMQPVPLLEAKVRLLRDTVKFLESRECGKNE